MVAYFKWVGISQLLSKLFQISISALFFVTEGKSVLSSSWPQNTDTSLITVTELQVLADLCTVPATRCFWEDGPQGLTLISS